MGAPRRPVKAAASTCPTGSERFSQAAISLFCGTPFEGPEALFGGSGGRLGPRLESPVFDPKGDRR
jgi:hypothetical protein